MTGQKSSVMPKEYITQLLEVSEMFRDHLNAQGKNRSLAYSAADTAIKNYYKHHTCPHRLAYIRVTKPSGGGCETTETYCPDCDTVIEPEETDC